MQQQGYIPQEGETHGSTITSADVNGTRVFSPSGDRLGTIDHLVIDKRSGNIAYAVMGFGGFLGLGEDHYPIPWKKLRYDTDRGGYVTDITQAQLESAPRLPENWRDNREWAASTYGHYGVPPYWL